jgi:exonuclease SbcC
MEGFASYRSRTVVDFEGVDYFALTGPTGSGKSTVIDGIVFALYGTAPRWGGTNVIRYALAPTINRATVRLIFDLGSQRYQVAREVRRTGQQLTQKSASFERILDPADESEVEVLASDAESVKWAVQKLLGISLEEFCKAVVLPQGQFAEFLTATPAARQEILLKLLGSQVYEQVRLAAGERQQAANEVVLGYEAQLSLLADVTDEAVSEARARREELTLLSADVKTRVARLADAREKASAAQRDLNACRQRSDLLARVEVPEEVAGFAERAGAVQEALKIANDEQERADTSYDAARTALDGGGDRAELQRVRDQWTQRSALEGELPSLAETAGTSAASSEAADRIAGEVQGSWQEARDQLTSAERAVEVVRATLEQARGRHTALAGIDRPPGVDGLAARVADAKRILDEAHNALSRAEEDDEGARRDSASLGTEGPLLQRQDLLERWSRRQGEITRIRSSIDAATDELEKLRLARDLAESATAAAGAALQSARDRHTAAALRSHLAVGEACPVCAQQVLTLPPALDTGGLEQLESNLAAANTALDDARRSFAKSEADAAATASTLSRLIAESSDLSAQLGVAGDSLDEIALQSDLADRLAAIKTAQQRCTATAAAVSQARAQRQAAVQAEHRLTEDADRARALLRSVREKVLAFGAPAVDDASLSDGWTTLEEWARAEITELETAELATAEAAVTSAEGALATARRRLTEKADAHTAAQNDARTAREVATRAESRLEQAQEAERALVELLSSAPPLAVVTGQLAELDRLTDLERSAYEERQLAHIALESAKARRAAFESERQEATMAFRSVREQLVPLGAPATDESDLAAAWQSLTHWAATAIAAAQQSVSDAQAIWESAESTAANYELELLAAVAAGGVVCPAADQAVVQVAAELGRVRSTLESLEERLTRREQIVVQQQSALRTRQVADLLSTHLRSQRFPRWLAGAALDILVSSASESLMELSGGQFSLTHDDKEFAVIDHTDAEAQRSVRTLSGGETFQASLALALALSGEFSGLSSAASSLDSIFLDEGFGSLDTDSLEVVAETLERLAQSDRMVGVVTHVTSLAERIPTRYLVSRNSRTSTVVREG